MTTASLMTVLHGTKPREIAGSRTAGRYGYQANIGILKLIELVPTEQDFCLVFDYFDDLAVLDHPDSPTSIQLYQVKTKDTGEWTISSLCKFEGKTKPRSIVSRLYAHAETFGACLGETGIISNAPYAVEMAAGGTSSGSRHRIASTDMSGAEHTKIIESIAKDYPTSIASFWLPKLVLIRAPLGVHNHEATIKGLLNEYLEAAGIADDMSLSAVYGALHANISQKMGFAQEGLSLSDLLARKSLSRQHFFDLLRHAARRPKNIVAVWDTIERDLVNDGRGSADIIRLRTCAVQYQQQRSSRQPQAHNLRSMADAWAKQNVNFVETCSTITGIATAMLAGIDNHCGYTPIQAYAAFIVEAYEVVYATT